MMNANAAEQPWVQIAPGIRRQTITTGPSMYQMRAHLDAGSRLPEHNHPQEQVTHVVKGRLRLIVDGVAHELTDGMSCYIRGDVRHSGEAMEETFVIDTFSPPREDYLTADRAAVAAQ
jgi:quercetin dioxygenase-like cupin family protein